MTDPFDGVDQEEVGMKDEAALLYRAAYDITSDRSAPAEGFLATCVDSGSRSGR